LTSDIPVSDIHAQAQPILETIAERGRRLQAGIKGIFERAGVPAHFHGHPTMFGFSVGTEYPTEQRIWSRSDKDYYLRLMAALYEGGVMPDYDPREPWFMCYSHADSDIDETLSAMDEAVQLVTWSQLRLRP
jgi:glutamate-1-semialdehyde 2,1-aminomutase